MEKANTHATRLPFPKVSECVTQNARWLKFVISISQPGDRDAAVLGDIILSTHRSSAFRPAALSRIHFAPVPCNCLRDYFDAIYRAQYRVPAIICAVIYLSVGQLLVDSLLLARLLINKSLRYYSFAVNLKIRLFDYCLQLALG